MRITARAACRRLLIVSLVLACAAGCTRGKFSRFGRGAKQRPSHVTPVAAALGPSPGKPKRESTRTSSFNVLLLTIDALRADVPWQGYTRNNAPRLSEFARECVVYANAYSVSSSTSKSLAALFTGRYPSALRRSGVFFSGYTETDLFLASTLRDQGIMTLGWQADPYLQHAKGLSAGYVVWKPLQSPQGRNVESTSLDLSRVGVDILIRPENTSRQFFAWTHAMDPHEPYVEHAECSHFGNGDRDRYDCEVCFTDHWLMNLLDWARKQPWWESTVVIVTSDHGETFGEHGMHHHAFELWEALVRVPLLIRVPGVPPRRIELRRSQIDLASTILELMGQPQRHASSSRSLAPELLGAAAPESREPIVLDLPENTHERARRAIIEGEYKLIDFGNQRFALYDLGNDPAEMRDLSASNPAQLAAMKRKMEAVSAGIAFVEPYGGVKLASGRTANGTL
jgi:choline-sulfatase